MTAKATTVLNEVLDRMNTVLGSTFTEHSNAYELESLSGRELENGYSCVIEDATEEVAQQLQVLRLTRTLVCSITYKTYSTATDNKTKTKQDTVLTNEEAIINDLRLRALTGAAPGRILTLDGSSVRVITSDNDAFLINEIRLKCFYTV